MNIQLSFLQTINEENLKTLQSLVHQIDKQGFYPKDYLMQLGKLGGFAAAATTEEGGLGLGLASQIDVIRKVGSVCGSSAFAVWCQAACGWYLHQSKRHAVRQKYLADVVQGKVLAGTAMSNTVKHLSGIEAHKLKAQKVGDTYIINGSLPWVSNIGENHVWASSAQLPDNRLIMFMVRGEQEGVSLKNCPEFCALEGTATFSVRMRDVVIKEEDILADVDEFDEFIHTIKPGFILLQMGIGAGIIEGCLKIMQDSNLVAGHVNDYLLDGLNNIEKEYQQLLIQTEKWARKTDTQRILDKNALLAILKLRLSASELSLRAAQSAALYAGAKGYLANHAAQRRSREAMFVAIVTPAIKHLRKEITLIQSQLAAA